MRAYERMECHELTWPGPETGRLCALRQVAKWHWQQEAHFRDQARLLASHRAPGVRVNQMQMKREAHRESVEHVYRLMRLEIAAQCRVRVGDLVQDGAGEVFRVFDILPAENGGHVLVANKRLVSGEFSAASRYLDVSKVAVREGVPRVPA